MVSFQFIIKRIIDLVIALILLVPAVLFSIVVGILIKNDSVGPVFFKQRRLGKNNKVFAMYKFRTMCQNAPQKRKELDSKNEADGFLFKIILDPRETKLGSKLRNIGLDELPQLLNVLRGEMSLVGPRPLPVEDVNFDRLKENPHFYHQWQIRKSVRPGITGFWQINTTGHSFSEMMNLDEQYVEKYSLWKDVKIIGKTFLRMAKGMFSTVLRHKKNYNPKNKKNIGAETVKE